MTTFKFIDGAGNKRNVKTTSWEFASLWQVLDVVRNEKLYFEKKENADGHMTLIGTRINPKTGKNYRGLLSLSSGLKETNQEPEAYSEEYKALTQINNLIKK